MNGLTLAEEYYKQFGEQMLMQEFADIRNQIAVGLVGSGSECFGYDDEISKDHDFEPGFTIFIPGETFMDSKTAFRLERAYAKLPKEFMGYTKTPVQPVGGNRHGVVRLDEFLTARLGNPFGELSEEDWLRLPENSILEVTNGKLFYDGSGTFTAIRQSLTAMPEDVRKKKISGHLLTMAQAGQYNYYRLTNRGEEGAAQMALYEFVKSGMQVVYSLNHRLMPYYKWAFRGMRDLEILSGLEESFVFLLTTGNDKELALKKANTVEEIAGAIIAELTRQGLSGAVCGDLEKHAYSVNDSIKSTRIRYLNIFAAV
ncbi:MAG: DUF4037 domain-containing protein [Lachnospiraceae bacterium]|nr:DUF4037 domain-containing protein [Lachnospiraceae bacterium]